MRDAKVLSDINIPRHIAIIPDGNGRWAKNNSLPRLVGHQRGAKRVKSIVKDCLSFGVEVVSVFAFSSENWHRPKKEVSSLMQLFKRTLQNELDTLKKYRIRLKVIGDTSRFSQFLQEAIHQAEEQTANNFDITLIIAANYGGMWDIVSATRCLAQQVAEETLNPNAISAELIESKLSTHEFPSPDLLIRTSGEQRISNFMIWQCAYSELYFSPKLWPDFNREDLLCALADYTGRERRFGLSSEQVNNG